MFNVFDAALLFCRALAMRSRRDKVLIFSPHFAEYSVRLALALSKYHEVFLIVEQQNLCNECPKQLISQAAKSLMLLPFKARCSTRSSTFVRERLIFKTTSVFAPHIIHLQEQGDVFTAKYCLAVRDIYPIVVTVHDPVPHSGRDAEFAVERQSYVRDIRKCANAFHVHGAYCAGLLQAILPNDALITSTPHAGLFIPPEVVPPREQGPVLFFGRMEAYKGLDVFLDALDELRNRGELLSAVIAGEGPELQRARVRISAMTGVLAEEAYLSPARISMLISECAFLVAPYKDATQSGVIATAFANGRTVVATNVGGLNEIVQHEQTGLLVPPSDAASLANAIQRLRTEEGMLLRLSRAAHDASNDLLSWDKVAIELTSFYQIVKGRFCRRGMSGVSHQS